MAVASWSRPTGGHRSAPSVQPDPLRGLSSTPGVAPKRPDSRPSRFTGMPPPKRRGWRRGTRTARARRRDRPNPRAGGGSRTAQGGGGLPRRRGPGDRNGRGPRPCVTRPGVGRAEGRLPAHQHQASPGRATDPHLGPGRGNAARNPRRTARTRSNVTARRRFRVRPRSDRPRSGSRGSPVPRDRLLPVTGPRRAFPPAGARSSRSAAGRHASARCRAAARYGSASSRRRSGGRGWSAPAPEAAAGTA